MSKDRKVIILGLDGATFDLITPWVEQGKLKTFARLLQEGSYGVLKSIIPPFSASAWSSFMTGKNPGKHGVVDFHYMKEGSYDLAFVSSRNRVGQTLWDIAGSFNKKVGIINVPITYPPDEVNGFMISGLGAPELSERSVYPPILFKELKQEIGDYIIKVHVRDFVRSGRLRDCRELLLKEEEKRYECIRYLMKNKPWDLFIAVFAATDHAQHFFWKYLDPDHPLYNTAEAEMYGDVIYSVYQLIDSYLGEIMEEIDNDTDLLIMSDHGAQPTSNKGLYLNNWLRREGFLTFKNETLPSKSLFPFKGLISAGKKFLPRRIKNRLKAIPFFKSKVETIFRWQNIDWTKTVAYSDVQRETIRLNLKGREPMGIVEPSRYHEVREEIIRKLKEFSDPDTDETIFSDIYRREELYNGYFASLVPDIICVQNRKFLHSVHYMASSSFKHQEPIKTYSVRELASDPSPNAVHSLDGIFIAWGKNIKKGSKVNEARITDIAPTVLYLMGLPIPSDMDGKILADIFKDSFMQENKVKYEEVKHGDMPEKREGGYTEEEEEEFKKALKGLGYL